jgi:hypothetical protein
MLFKLIFPLVPIKLKKNKHHFNQFTAENMNKIHETFCSEAIYLSVPSKQIIPLVQIWIDIKYILKIQIIASEKMSK